MTGPGLVFAQWVRIRWWNACAWYAVTLAEALARAGHQSFLLAPSNTPAHREAQARGLPTPDLGDIGGLRSWLGAQGAIQRFLKKESVDLVNVHSGPGHLQFSRACRSLGISVVRTRGDIRPPSTGLIQRWLYRGGTDHHLLSANFLRAPYARLDVDDSRISVLHGGVDVDHWQSVDRSVARASVADQLGLSEDVELAGMIARLSPVKGHDDVLRAIAELRVRRPRLHLVLAGGDAQLTRTDIENLARELGIADRVHLVGRVEDPVRWARAFDLAVIASTGSEAICRSAFEYLAAGTPVVATRINAVEEVLSDEIARLVPASSPAALAESIDDAFTDPEETSRRVRRGSLVSRDRFSLDAFGAAAAGVFRQVRGRDTLQA